MGHGITQSVDFNSDFNIGDDDDMDDYSEPLLEDYVPTDYSWHYSDGSTAVIISGSTRISMEGKVKFTLNLFSLKGNRFSLYTSNISGINEYIETKFNERINSFLSNHCVKVQKNENVEYINMMLEKNETIFLMGVEYYIPKNCPDDKVFHRYLIENFI